MNRWTWKQCQLIFHEQISNNLEENSWKPSRGGVTGIHNPMLNRNLSTMIRWYTGRVTYEAHKINSDFAWHGRFDDRIIQDLIQYKNMTRYIRQNPINWKEDEYNGFQP